MGGAGDNITILEPNRHPNVAKLVLGEWLSRAIAPTALALDHDREAEDRLLLPAELPAEDSELAAMLTDWFGSLTGQPIDPSNEQVEHLLELYYTVLKETDSEEAQLEALGIVLEGLIQHPLVRVY